MVWYIMGRGFDIRWVGGSSKIPRAGGSIYHGFGDQTKYHRKVVLYTISLGVKQNTMGLGGQTKYYRQVARYTMGMGVLYNTGLGRQTKYHRQVFLYTMVCGFDMTWVLGGQIRYHRQVVRYTMGRVSINHGLGGGVDKPRVWRGVKQDTIGRWFNIPLIGGSFFIQF